MFGIEVPTGFERALRRGDRPALLLAADATDPVAVVSAFSSLQDVVATALANDHAVPDGAQPAFEIREHRRYNPAGSTQLHIVPGLLGTILTMTMLVFTGLSLTREAEQGTMEGLLAMPIAPLEIMLGKISPYVLVGFMQGTLVLGAAVVLFSVPVTGSLALLASLTILFITTNLSIGYTFSTFARSQLQSVQMVMMFFLPNILLSGFMFPFSGMPSWAQAISECLPLTHYLRIVRAIMLKGATLADLNIEALWLAGLMTLARPSPSPASAALWIDAMDTMNAIVPLTGNAGTRALAATGLARTDAAFDWLQEAVYNKLTDRRADVSRGLALAQRLFSFAEFNALVARIEADPRPDRFDAIAAALDLRFEFSGLENLRAAQDRPVILFANHPTGGGNVLGMAKLFADHFSDYRILATVTWGFLRVLVGEDDPGRSFPQRLHPQPRRLARIAPRVRNRVSGFGRVPGGNILANQSRQRRHHGSALVGRLHADCAPSRRSLGSGLVLRPQPAALLSRGQNSNRIGLPRPGFRISPAAGADDRGPCRQAHIGGRVAPNPEAARPDELSARGRLRTCARTGREAAGWRQGNGPQADAGRNRRRGRDPRADRGSRGPNGDFGHSLAGAGLENKCSGAALDGLSPIRRSFRLPAELAGASRRWLEVVGLDAECGAAADIRMICRALKSSAATPDRTGIVALVHARETNFVLASLEMALLQKFYGDVALLRARARVELIGAVRHHDWRPQRDVAGLDRRSDAKPAFDPLLRKLARLGVRFGAAGVSADTNPRPCILARFDLPAGKREVLR